MRFRFKCLDTLEGLLQGVDFGLLLFVCVTDFGDFLLRLSCVVGQLLCDLDKVLGDRLA